MKNHLKENYKRADIAAKIAHKIHRKGIACVWVNFSGHVDLLTIEMTPTKELYHNKVFNRAVYLDHENNEAALERLILDLMTIEKIGIAHLEAEPA